MALASTSYLVLAVSKEREGNAVLPDLKVFIYQGNLQCMAKRTTMLSSCPSISNKREPGGLALRMDNWLDNELGCIQAKEQV